MSIQVNSGTKVNWESVLSALGDVSKTTDVDGKESFTITMKSGDDVRTYNVSIPDDLEIPETFDSASIQSLIDKLGNISEGMTEEQKIAFEEGLKQGLQNVRDALKDAKPSTSSLMFDIYALMALLAQVAQTQRDAMREQRTAQNALIQKSIQDQADQQKAAAYIGLVVGVITGAISAGASLTMMGLQGWQAGKQADIMNASGTDAQTIKVDMLAKADTTAHAQNQLQGTINEVGGDIAGRVRNNYEAQINDPETGNLRGNFNAAKQTFDQKVEAANTAKTQLDTAKADLQTKEGVRNQAQSEYDAKKAEVGLDAKQTEYDNAVNAKNEAVQAKENLKSQLGNQAFREDDLRVAQANQRIAEAETRVNNAKTALDEAKNQLAPKETALNNAKEAVTTAQNEVNLKQQAYDSAKNEVSTAKGALDTARNDLAKRSEAIADDYTAKYDAAVKRLADPPAGSDKTQLKADVETARKEMKMARALQANELAQEGVLSPGEHHDMVKMARMEADNATNRTINRADFKDAERKIALFAGLNGLVMSMGQLGQSIAQGLNQIEQAEATRTGAQQQEMKEELEQTKDLYTKGQDLVDQVIKLMQAVNQAEVQSQRDAIQA